MELQAIAEHIKQRELELLQTDWKANPALVDDLLSADFEEINSNGQVSTRSDVINWLLNKDNAIQWLLIDFRIKALTDGLVMAVYFAKKLNDPNSANKDSIRTSIWQRQGNNWKMVFHQATQRIET
ncbi:MAG: DUF4440 domain-containing protein [Nitrosomonas sp.]|nr:DUF4440 domain-containing protein [Nitrosomonas sp.]